MKAQEEGGLGPQECREGEGKAVLGDRSVDLQKYDWVRSRRDPGTPQDQHTACGRSSRAGALISTQDLGATGNVKQGNRTTGLCFRKSLLEVPLIPGEGKKSKGRWPFQRVPCPWGKRETGHQSFLREQTFELL